MADKTAKTYAKVVQEEAKKRNFDPFSIVAMIHKESWWNPSAVSPGGDDWGLAQTRVRFIGACRTDMESEGCKRVKASFLNPIYSIRWASARITTSREFCRKLRGRATYHGWLSVWQGSMKQDDKSTWCKKNKHTTSRIKYRRKLVNLANRGRLKMKRNK